MTGAFWVLLRREFGAFLLSPMAYVIFFCISVINAISFYFVLEFSEQGLPNITIMQVFFLWVMFWFAVIPMAPFITMRLFSEEYRSGTVELLMTAPVTEWDVVLAKFFGALIFFCGVWLTTLVYLLAFQYLSEHAAPVPWGSLILIYSLVGMVGALFISIGLFCSSMTKNQVVAAISSFSIILVLFFLGLTFNFTANQGFVDFIQYISAYNHMQTFAFGTFDSRPVVWYLSGTLLFLVLTQRVIAARKLKA